MLTIRSSTVDLLANSVRRVGPSYSWPTGTIRRCRQEQDRAEVAKDCSLVAFSAKTLLPAVEPLGRTLSVTDGTGVNLDSMVYMLRRDGNIQWLFLVNRIASPTTIRSHQAQGVTAEEWDPTPTAIRRRELARRWCHYPDHVVAGLG